MQAQRYFLTEIANRYSDSPPITSPIPVTFNDDVKRSIDEIEAYMKQSFREAFGGMICPDEYDLRIISELDEQTYKVSRCNHRFVSEYSAAEVAEAERAMGEHR